MEGMFEGCNDLNTIYVGSGWSIAVDAEAHYSDGMFSGCTSLVGGMGTAYDAEHVDATYAHIDGGPSDPGYFTAGPASLRGDADGNGEVGISDVTAIIDYLLKGDATTINLTAADADGNGEIGISDVTAIIDYLLKKTWPDEVPEEPQTETFTVNGVSFTMVAVDGGTFTMGATAEQGDDAYYSEKPAHEVTLSDYRIGQTEVTQELWQAVMGSNPSYFSSNNGYTTNLQRPVETVSWNDCQTFITQLNALTGKTFRLPTEAEWEFAARGGNKSQGYKYAGSNTVGDVAWYWDNIPSQSDGTAGYGTQTVATKAPNELGLYDMSGNVWEWCQDWYGSYSSDAQTNPTGPSTGSYRVGRGGGWDDSAWYCRVSIRIRIAPAITSGSLGLRLAL
jgi:formylglycine-generating enzyme required for sulfatase activity